MDQLTEIVRALEIQSPTNFTFAGKSFDVSTHTYQQSVAGYASTNNPLIAALQMCLYANCYCQPFRGALAATPQQTTPPVDLSQRLSEANVSRARWDSGWQIIRIEQSGQITAQKASMVRALWPGEFHTYDGPGIPPRVGSQVSVYFPKESKTMQPGFYFAFGEEDAGFSSDARLVRFYWNIPEEGAVPLTRWITQILNRYQLPFRFKCLSWSGQFQRVDAAVLYINKQYFRFAAELAANGCDHLEKFLRPETPLFSRQLAPGLGIAEDPANGESFGMNRCRILAEGLWNAFNKKISAEQERLQEVVRCFAAYGLDTKHIHLNARSANFYDTPAFAG